MLEDAGLSPQRSQQLTDAYTAQRDEIRRNLLSTNMSLMALADVDWRLDYVMKSDVMEKMDEPAYLLSLKGMLPLYQYLTIW